MTRLSWTCGLAIAALTLACGKSNTGLDGGNDGGLDAGDAGSDAGPQGLSCSALLPCDQDCGTSESCTDGCYFGATAVAQGLFDALNDCIGANCSSGPGGPCASSSSSTCANCNENAATGPCVANLLGCEGDMTIGPPNLDGGAVIPDAGTGPALNCGGLIACVSACPIDAGSCISGCTDQATPEALALNEVLNGCLAMACPSTDGGPCEIQASAACNGCIEQVEFALPDTCAAPFIDCNNDTSNLPDAGDAPRAVQDGGVLSIAVSGIDQAASTLAVRDGYLYFTEVITNGLVHRVWLADGGAAETVGPPQPTPVALAVDSNNIYVWSTGTFPLSGDLNNNDGTVVQIPLDGGAAITLGQNLEVEYDAPYLNAVAVDAHNVYWVAGANGNDGVIMRAPIGSANAEPLYTGQFFPEAIATDGTNVYWTNWGTFDAQGHTNNDGTVMQGSVDGGVILTLASNLAAPACIAIDANNVYWTNLGPLGGGLLPAPNTGSVMQAPIGGGGPAFTLASAQAIPLGITTANGVVYWTEYGLSAPGLIVSAAAGTTTVVPLAAGLPNPEEITVAGNLLYWTDTPSSDGNGTIVSLTLP